MRFALISDIHANLAALEAVLKDIDGQTVDAIHCLGDVIGYGCDPGKCLELVTQHCNIKLVGNHEHATLGLLSAEHLNRHAQQAISWTTKQLTDYDFSLIADFVMDAHLDQSYLVHSSPFEPETWHYILSVEDAETAFAHCTKQFVFFGHTHLPAIYSVSEDSPVRAKYGHDIDPDPDARYLVNVGSVGQPRDNDPRACYVIFDTEEIAITYRRVAYDVKSTQEKMARASMPAALIDRLEVGR
ncbi:MAG: metallophosphatase family protein [candidate division Zixibacteria bacterium]|nr:metallophosphatase family protein [candidate division Zixibacteria bacterium]